MDKKTAQQLIEDTFSEKFNDEQFTIFAKNLLNDLEPKSNSYSGNYIWDDYKDHINTYKRIGKYIDPDGEALDVLIVEVKSVAKLERARTTLRNFIIKHLSKFEKDYALVAFYSKEDDGADWRFSFIKFEYRSELDEEKGKVKTKKEFTPAKRYSFLVGKHEKSHTAKNQLLPLLQNISNNPTIHEIESAFSIEKVTDEFFQQYKDLYIKVFEHFENDTHVKSELEKADIDNTRFTKKLLGQIVFLYFLQKKGWLGVPQNERWGSGKKRFVQELFDQAQAEGRNFFKDKLQYLFYEALAKERDNENSYYERFGCRIPFLNGGLFEADYNWQAANITIPEGLFRNDEKNKSGDIGTGILDVFDRYNFTIKEDEPLDKEVAVDPEMLGKVFENMLDITERKSKGAFYTPREIVHYMCQESLIHYLDNVLNSDPSAYQPIDTDQLSMYAGSTGKKGNLKLEFEHKSKSAVPKNEIEAFIRNGHLALENDQRVATMGESKTYQYQLPESIRQNADLIDQKLSDIKICDPAIGSGAFPVGLMHELVSAMLVLKPHLSYSYLTQKLKSFGFEHRESVNESRYVYRLKRHIIQESIYGVDIDASAIDIARLRLWLSLVVDEDDLDPIETLPNLDYKIVCGNSLIGLPDGAMRNLQVEAELETLKDKFYDLTNEKEKRAVRQKINTKIRELLDSAEQFAGYKIDFDFKLFFSEVWGDKGGFDVLIGNPPYVEFKNLDGELKNKLKRIYTSTKGKFDIYIPFIEKSHQILTNNGMMIFINPTRFMHRDYGKDLRIFVNRLFRIREIIDFGNVQKFDTATTYTGIFSFIKEVSKDYEIKFRTSISEKAEYYKSTKLADEVWYFNPPIVQNLIEKIKKYSKPLDSFLYGILQGIATGKDEVFIVNEEFVNECKIEKEFLVKFLMGKDISPFKINWKNKYCIYPYDMEGSVVTESELKKKAPNLYTYLDENREKLSGRDYFENSNKLWFELWNQRSKKNFSGNKLITLDNASKNSFALDTSGFMGTTTTYSLIPKEGINILTLLGVLNSDILTYYHIKNTIPQDNGFYRYQKIFIKDLPIICSYNQLELEYVISYLLFINQFDTELDLVGKFFYSLSNCIVFELYFPAEIKSAGKEILKHLGDLKPITDKMSEEEKLAIIQSEFERLHNPNHPVRIAIDTLDSVEEVRIIREALK